MFGPFPWSFKRLSMLHIYTWWISNIGGFTYWFPSSCFSWAILNLTELCMGFSILISISFMVYFVLHEWLRYQISSPVLVVFPMYFVIFFVILPICMVFVFLAFILFSVLAVLDFYWPWTEGFQCCLLELEWLLCHQHVSGLWDLTPFSMIPWKSCIASFRIQLGPINENFACWHSLPNILEGSQTNWFVWSRWPSLIFFFIYRN